MMLCHRFYMSQSHAKNDWQTIATVSAFLACKIKETPRFLNDVVVVSYEMIYKWDPSAPRRIRQKEVFNKQKDLILVGERILLSTIAFDFNIELPYEPLVTALKRLNIFSDLAKVAWNFVNDWLGTTLCLQYKAPYIAAASLFLAAKLRKVKLPIEKGRVWWQEFDVSLKLLEEVIQEMHKLLGQDRKEPLPSSNRNTRPIQSKASLDKPLESSSLSCITSESVTDCQSNHGDVVEHGGSKEYSATHCSQNVVESDKYSKAKKISPHHTSNSVITSSAVEEGNGVIQPTAVDTIKNARSKVSSIQNSGGKLDVIRIKEMLKKRKCNGVLKKPLEAIDAEKNSEDLIESELEIVIELGIASTEKKQRKLH
ncbi:cyclin-T1-3-like isoform X2 [Humulus lupulus]|nr:cyclin-T1-3-like isoform X2 [Humulus lupulus]